MSEFATILSRISARVPLRNMTHFMLACMIAVVAPYAGIYWTVVGATILGSIFLWTRKHVAFRVFHTTTHVSYGEFFFLCGACASAVLFFSESLHAWYAAMFTLAFADSFAAFIGAKGRHVYYIYTERRTCEGTLTCAIISGTILAVFGVPFIYAIFSGLLLAGIETISIRGSDNLTLPVVAGLITLTFATV